MPANKVTQVRYPFTPMEAVSVRSIPEGENLQYEPKFDGFRCLALKDGDAVTLQSKSEKLLTTSFPEIAHVLKNLAPATLVLDGELVIAVSGQLSFDHLLMRLTQSAARARKLAEEFPAVYFVFDLLVNREGRVLVDEPLRVRRAELEECAKEYFGEKGLIQLAPATCDIAVARKWFELVGDSLDGVIAKRLDLPYQSGESRGMQKIKRIHTLDCVVGGVIVKGEIVSHLLLGAVRRGWIIEFRGILSFKAT